MWPSVHCPHCRAADTKVVDSRETADGTAIRRRRECGSCHHRFTTFERYEPVHLMVVKSDGSKEQFDAAKIAAGVEAASKGRPVTAEQVARLTEAVEEVARIRGGEVTSAALGVDVLERLRDLDEVAYVRFASVYKNFDAAEDFHRELDLLEKRHRVAEPADLSDDANG